MPKTLPASQFKERCLALLDQVDADGIIITKRGKPVAKLVAWERASGELLGSLRGKVVVKGDITSTKVRWDAES
ncbi:MAG: type II toxin-antitoxin system Phd/YefM family antitoxin [Polyangiaceae bacterium]|nr:type II toxin-antitoxin system Phd/YefM family antitoxin [Polyangiaceae bacterium]